MVDLGLPGQGAPSAGRSLLDPPGERADAARNRQKILDAAASIATRFGIESLSVNAVARAAGVGVGTVYRRFGDRAGLITALIDQSEQDFQRAFLLGPPPLGPGAHARIRIGAFLHTMVDRIDEVGPFMLAAERTSPTARFSPAYAVHHAHLSSLLAELGTGHDTTYLADALLASVAANLVTFQLRTRKISTARIKNGLDELLDGLQAAHLIDLPSVDLGRHR